MGNRNANRVNQRMNTEADRINRDYTQYGQERQGYADDARTRSNRLADTAEAGYNDLLGRVRAPGFGSRGGSSRGYYKDFADTGGLDEENKTRIRGKGVFDEYARTGGVSEGDKGNIRSRLTRGIPSFYQTMADELRRANANAGGANPTFGASEAAIAREQSQRSSDAISDAEFGIMDRVNEGRKWGASSLSDAESRLVDALQRGKMFGAEGLSREDDADWQANAAKYGLELEGLQGLRGLRTEAPGEVFGYEDLIAGGMGARGGQQGAALDRLAAYNPNRSFIERAAPYIGAAGSVAGMFGGGGIGSAAGRALGFGRGRNTGIYRGPEQYAPWYGS